MLNRLLNVVNHILNDENGMELNSYILDNVWTNIGLCIKYWCLCGNKDLRASLMI